MEIEKLKEGLMKASEKYSELTAIRAGINAIPFVGGSIDVLISGEAQKIAQRRIEDLISSLSTQLQQVQ